MIVFNQTNSFLYFATSIVSGLVLKQYIYGPMVFMLMICILGAMMYNKHIGTNEYVKIPGYIMMVLVILVGLYVLFIAPIETFDKLIPIVFLLSSIIIYGVKWHFKPEILNSTIGNLIPSLLLMVFILNVSYIPENKTILNDRLNDIKELLGIYEV